MLRRAAAAEARRRISVAPPPRRRISVAPARLAHELAQPQAQSAGPKRRGLEPWWLPLYRRISKVSDGRPPGIVAAEMDEWLRQRPRLSEQQILAYVRELTRFKKNEGALELLDWMEARGANLSPDHQAMRLGLVSKQIFQEWQSNHEHYDMRITNIMIKAYLDKGMIDEAEAISQSTMAQGRCDERTVYIFAEFYLDKSDVNAALEILRDAKNMVTAHKRVPLKELVNRFLKHYEEAKDVAGMKSFLECLKKLECLDVETYDAIMQTYIVEGRTLDDEITEKCLRQLK